MLRQEASFVNVPAQFLFCLLCLSVLFLSFFLPHWVLPRVFPMASTRFQPGSRVLFFPGPGWSFPRGFLERGLSRSFLFFHGHGMAGLSCLFVWSRGMLYDALLVTQRSWVRFPAPSRRGGEFPSDVCRLLLTMQNHYCCWTWMDYECTVCVSLLKPGTCIFGPLGLFAHHKLELPIHIRHSMGLTLRFVLQH